MTSKNPFMDIRNKVALVTGSSRGVGRSVAQQLAARGCRVVINHRDSEDQAQETLGWIESHGGKAIILRADVSEESACRSLVNQTIAHWGQLDILINNAATTNFLRFDDLDALTEDHWDRVLQTNVKAPFYMVRAARRWLEASTEGGEIIHITSIAGMTGNGSSLAYCASKAALINMTLSMARILAPKIRVNAVAPGFIADQWTQQGLGKRYGAAVQTHTQKALLGKVSEPEDVAMAVLSLITGSDMITGQNLVCDGGSMIGPRA